MLKCTISSSATVQKSPSAKFVDWAEENMRTSSPPSNSTTKTKTLRQKLRGSFGAFLNVLRHPLGHVLAPGQVLCLRSTLGIEGLVLQL
jgi:hypothetical protein